jgi:hypothetical protein
MFGLGRVQLGYKSEMKSYLGIGKDIAFPWALTDFD